MRRAAVLIVAIVFGVPWWQGSPIAGVAGSDAVQPALERFIARPDEPIKEYRAIRHMEAENHRFNLRGSLDAVTALDADGHFSYTILREEGSDYVRSKVLRPVLENEEKLFATTDPSRAALTPLNYELNAAEPAEPGVVRLLAKPRRREITLVDGSVFVTTEDADLVRVEGRLAKNPSFWTTRVDVVRRYERRSGIRVPVRLDTTAQIRVAGASTMSVVYDYEMVNGVSFK